MEVDPDPTRIWCVFDMDETLGCFQNLFGLNAFLSPEILTEEGYRNVVNTLATLIREGFDVGFLRPGLHLFFSVIQQLKNIHCLQGAAIYSNNSWQYTVRFMVDIINSWFPGLVCEGISRMKKYPFEADPDFRRTNMVFNEQGILVDYRKQWSIVQNIFRDAKCSQTDPEPAQTFFFDDTLHDHDKYGSDLKAVLGNNFIQNSAYRNGVNPDFWPILRNILRHHGLIDADEVLLPIIQQNIHAFPGFNAAEKARFRAGTINIARVKYAIYDIIPFDGFYPYVAQNVGEPFEALKREYEQLWITPIYNKLTDEEKHELNRYPRGGSRTRPQKTRRRRHQRRILKKTRSIKKIRKIVNKHK